MSRLARLTRVSRRRDERGSAVVELVWLGILLLVPLIYLVVSVFTVQQGAFGVSGAARAAGRAYALAPDDASGLRAARAAAQLALHDQGLDGAPLDVRVTCTPDPHDCHQGTSVITVSIGSRVDLPLVPDALGGGKPSIPLSASQTEPIGRYQELDP